MLLFCTVPANDDRALLEVNELDGLLARIAQGEQAAFEVLYRRTHSAVYAYVLSVLKNTHEAEDVLHDCYLQVWTGSVGYRSQGKPMAWMLTIAKNLCRMRMRETKKQSDIPQEDWSTVWADNGQADAEDRLMLRGCMERLSDEERQIVVLHAVSGFKHREIAEMCELPLSTVLSKYNRAIKKLREFMEGRE